MLVSYFSDGFGVNTEASLLSGAVAKSYTLLPSHSKVKQIHEKHLSHWTTFASVWQRWISDDFLGFLPLSKFYNTMDIRAGGQMKWFWHKIVFVKIGFCILLQSHVGIAFKRHSNTWAGCRIRDDIENPVLS